MATPEVIREAADRLWKAATSGEPCAPVRDLIAVDDIEGAYAVAQRNVARIVEERGWRPNGQKIGLTSPAVQQQLGVDRPDFGTLFAELAHTSGEVVPVADLLQPKVEAEVALVLRHDLDLKVHTIADVIGAVDYVLPALEVVDSRVADWKITFVDTVADNASSGLYVLGSSPAALGSFDPIECGMVMERHGEPVSTGAGRACLGSPVSAMAWLARTMASVGRPLSAGDTVLSGALGPVVAVQPGDVFEARISGLGSVSASFSEGPS